MICRCSEKLLCVCVLISFERGMMQDILKYYINHLWRKATQAIQRGSPTSTQVAIRGFGTELSYATHSYPSHFFYMDWVLPLLLEGKWVSRLFREGLSLPAITSIIYILRYVTGRGPHLLKACERWRFEYLLSLNSPLPIGLHFSIYESYSHGLFL